MIIKSSGFLYLFDLDGTLVGSNHWMGFLKNTRDCFRLSHFNPVKYDIRWSLLTGRPKIDRFIVNLILLKHKLHPSNIITLPTWFYHFKDPTEVYKYKAQVLKDILDQKLVLKGQKQPINKIIYVDNDLDGTLYMNTIRDNYSYLCISVIDFVSGKNLEQVIL